MTVVLDTNALVQMFGQASPHAPLKRALLDGRLTLAISTPMLLEYEEVICRLAGRARWEDVARMFTLISLLHGTIREVAPAYRFRTITADADDDAFADCAITAQADHHRGPALQCPARQRLRGATGHPGGIHPAAFDRRGSLKVGRRFQPDF